MYPDEPNVLSPGGLHLLHHDIVDRLGEVAVRATRLIDVSPQLPDDRMHGLPGCACLNAATIKSRTAGYAWPGREAECLLYSSGDDAYCCKDLDTSRFIRNPHL